MEKKRIHPYSSAPELTNFHNNGESPTEGVLGRSHSCREMSGIKIITTQTTPANATVAVERAENAIQSQPALPCWDLGKG